MTMAPSPKTAAQRFTEPERTSPATKVPGRLVSSGPGGRVLDFRAHEPAIASPGFDEAFFVAFNIAV
jgi:hypothetical protein